MDLSFALLLRDRDPTELNTMLHAIQVRLGTSDENHQDLDRAQAIAHQLNNLLTSQNLRRGLDGPT